MADKKPLSKDLIEMWGEIRARRSATLAEAARTENPKRARSLRGQAGSLTRFVNSMSRALADDGYDVSPLEVSA
jgi:hypothetical protein